MGRTPSTLSPNRRKDNRLRRDRTRTGGVEPPAPAEHPTPFICGDLRPYARRTDTAENRAMTLTSHQYWDDGRMFGWSWVAMVVLMVGFWAIIVWLGITLARRPSADNAPPPPASVPGGCRASAAEILAERRRRRTEARGHRSAHAVPLLREPVRRSLTRRGETAVPVRGHGRSRRRRAAPVHRHSGSGGSAHHPFGRFRAVRSVGRDRNPRLSAAYAATRSSIWLMAPDAPSTTPISSTFCSASAESYVLVNVARVPESIGSKA
jgi:hypothetical protein